MECETNDCRKEKRGCKGCYYGIDYAEGKDITVNGCIYCKEIDNSIHGISIRNSEWKKTAGYKPQENYKAIKDYYRPEALELLELFTLKGKAGLMINNISGARYIDINYCPFCGRKLV